jgi:hypothetical protein
MTSVSWTSINPSVAISQIRGSSELIFCSDSITSIRIGRFSWI